MELEREMDPYYDLFDSAWDEEPLRNWCPKMLLDFIQVSIFTPQLPSCVVLSGTNQWKAVPNRTQLGLTQTDQNNANYNF